MEIPPLSPLALDGSARLHGWGAEEDFDMDFEELFKDVEHIDSSTTAAAASNPQQQQDDPRQEQPLTTADDGGDDGASSCSATGGDELLSLSDATTAAASPNASAVIERDEPRSVGCGAPSGVNTTWSAASASEDSDDGSRLSVSVSVSGSNCAFGGGSSSGPLPFPTKFISSGNSSDNSSSDNSSNIEAGAPRSITSEASTLNNDDDNINTNNNNNNNDDDDASANSKRLLSVYSGAGTPILPFTFAPAFGSGTAPAGATLPNFGALAAASGAAGQALAAGWKRLRGGDDGASASAHGQACMEGGVGGGGGGDGGEGQARINKRAKREERLMKNREAANRSRVKRKEVLSELQNRIDTLSSSLATSRNESAALQQEVASLREQNSFLRGMLSVQGNGNGNAVDLPPPVAGSTTHYGRPHQGGGGGGGGRGASAAAAAASAILGAVGTGLAVMSCVALSAAGFGENGGARNGVYGGSHPGYGGGGGGISMGGGVHNGGVPSPSHAAYVGRGGAVGYGNNNMGGRRMLLSVEESGDLPFPAGGGWEEGEEAGDLSLGLGGGWLGGYNDFLNSYVFLALMVAVGLALVFIVARWTYRKAVAPSRSAGGARDRARRRGRDRRQGNGGVGLGSLGGVWPVSGLLGGGKPVRKSM